MRVGSGWNWEARGSMSLMRFLMCDMVFLWSIQIVDVRHRLPLSIRKFKLLVPLIFYRSHDFLCSDLSDITSYKRPFYNLENSFVTNFRTRVNLWQLARRQLGVCIPGHGHRNSKRVPLSLSHLFFFTNSSWLKPFSTLQIRRLSECAFCISRMEEIFILS